MEHYLRPNLSVRPIAPLGSAGQIRNDTVCSEFTRMVARSGDPTIHEYFEATTPAQVTQSLLLAGSEIAGSGMVVLDAKIDPETKRFGELTITTTENKTFGISIHPLAANARQNLNRLALGPLAPIFAWLANRTVVTVVADLPRWRAFMKACGRENGLVQGLTTAARIAERAIQQGRIVLPPGTTFRPEDAVPLLCHAYLGAYDGPAPEDVYNRVFPDVERPVYRREEELYEWVGSRSDGRRHVSLHQVRLLKHEPRAILRGLLDTVREHMEAEDEGLPSRDLAKVNKKGLVAGLKMKDEGKEKVDVEFVQDENALGVVPSREMEQMEKKRQAALQFFGDLQDGPETTRPPPPGAFFRVKLLFGRCMYCGHVHKGPNDLCDLARRGAEHRISVQEVNCDHCFLHDHYIRACPTLHFRCQGCYFLGHITILCQVDTTSAHLRVFMVSCRYGLYTQLERHGPFSGPFGFGVALPIHLSERTLRTAREIRILNERRYANASDYERRTRAEMVRYVLCTVPLLNVHYQMMKAPTDTWQGYWERSRMQHRYDQGRDPYRGPDAPWLREYYREPCVQEYYEEAGDPVAEYEVDTDDAACRVEQIEGERAECRALLRGGDEEEREETFPTGESGRNRFSASMISEPEDEDVVCLGVTRKSGTEEEKSGGGVTTEGLLQRQEALERRLEEALSRLAPVPAVSRTPTTPRRWGPPPRKPVMIGRQKSTGSPYSLAGTVCRPRLLPAAPASEVPLPSPVSLDGAPTPPASISWVETSPGTATTGSSPGTPRTRDRPPLSRRQGSLLLAAQKTPPLSSITSYRARCRPRREDVELLRECEVRLTRVDEIRNEERVGDVERRSDEDQEEGSSCRVGVTTRAAARRYPNPFFK